MPLTLDSVDPTIGAEDPTGKNPTGRFMAETVIVSVSVLLNIFGVVLVRAAQRARPSVFHLLYFNLAVSNLIACPATWMCNNLTFLFDDWFREASAEDSNLRCRSEGYKLVGVYVAFGVGIQMTFAMLGLTLLQYLGLCHPRTSEFFMQKRRAYIFVTVAACVSLLCVVVPFSIMLVRTSPELTCDDAVLDKLRKNIILIANVQVAIITALYISISVVSIRVFIASRNIELFRVHLYPGSQLAETKSAFKTTMVLLLTLTVFFIPFTIYFVVHLNMGGIAKVDESVAIYYMTMMPCAKCIFDPFIYLWGMRHVSAGATERLAECCRKSQDVGRSGSDPASWSSNGETNLNVMAAYPSTDVLHGQY